MPDTITPSDQALIDAAIEAGRVTQIETGASSFSQIYWDGKDLRDPDYDEKSWGFYGAKRKGHKYAPQDRRKRVMERKGAV